MYYNMHVPYTFEFASFTSSPYNIIIYIMHIAYVTPRVLFTHERLNYYHASIKMPAQQVNLIMVL